MRYPFILVSILALLFSFAAPVSAAANGSLIKNSTNSSVYYLLEGKRYAFPDEKVFFSWYDDFKSVLTVSASELSSYVLAGNVRYRPGRWLVKIQTDPKVYAVSRYGVLRWITSEEVASALYGTNWPTKLRDIPDTFFINYSIGAPIVNTQDYSRLTELAITQISQNTFGAVGPIILSPQSAFERKTFDLINQHRQSKRLIPLAWNDAIANAARDHSKDMATGTVPFGHNGFADRIDDLRTAMDISSAAENVAFSQGYADPVAAAVEGWLNNPGHLTNIENPSYNQTGIGITLSSNGSYYFTQIFVQSPSTF